MGANVTVENAPSGEEPDSRPVYSKKGVEKTSQRAKAKHKQTSVKKKPSKKVKNTGGIDIENISPKELEILREKLGLAEQRQPVSKKLTQPREP